MSEKSQVEDPVVDYARSKGFIARKLKWIGRNGGPDRFFSKKGRGPFLVEFKATGEEPNLQQSREIKRLRDGGVTVHVIDNTADGYALFD